MLGRWKNNNLLLLEMMSYGHEPASCLLFVNVLLPAADAVHLPLLCTSSLGVSEFSGLNLIFGS